jgi:TRAP-type uncharacterized transport system fused permease subunit
MKTRLIITYLLNLFDLICTMHLVKRFGIEIEANPIGRWMIQNGSIYAVKIGVIGVALFVLYRCLMKWQKWKWTSWLVLAVYAILAIYHIFIYLSVINR